MGFSSFLVFSVLGGLGLVLLAASWSPLGGIGGWVKHLNWDVGEEAREGHGRPVHTILDAVSPVYEPANLYGRHRNGGADGL